MRPTRSDPPMTSWGFPPRLRRGGADFILVDDEILALRRCSCPLQFVGQTCPNAETLYLYRPPTAS